MMIEVLMFMCQKKNREQLLSESTGHRLNFKIREVKSSEKFGFGLGIILLAVLEPGPGGEVKLAAKGSGDVVNVFRVYGGKAKPNGFSWTSVDPNSVGNFRNAAGLPNVNTGRFVIEGTVKRSSVIKTRSALPLDGNKGGLLEFIIDPKNVKINRVSGANPTF